MEKTAGNATRGSKAGYVAAAVFLGASLANMAGPVRAETGAIQDLSRYCTACWRNARLHPDSWSDCTQEVFCRLLQTVPAEDWGQLLSSEGMSARDSCGRSTPSRNGRSGLVDSEACPRPCRRPGRMTHGQEEQEGLRAVAAKRTTQARIVDLSLEGWTVQEIAAKLETPPARISDDKYKAIRKLGRHLKAG